MHTVEPRRSIPELYSWLLGGLSTLLGALGQLLFRRFGQLQNPEVLFEWALPNGFGFLCVGVACYLVAVLLWIRVLRDLPLSRAYPLLSLSYPLVYLGALVWLEESMSTQRTLGTALVTVGALLAASPVKSPAKSVAQSEIA